MERSAKKWRTKYRGRGPEEGRNREKRDAGRWPSNQASLLFISLGHFFSRCVRGYDTTHALQFN